MSIYLEVGNPRETETGHRQLCPSTKGKERRRGTVTTKCSSSYSTVRNRAIETVPSWKLYRRVHKQRTVDQRKYPNGKQNWTAGYLQNNANTIKVNNIKIQNTKYKNTIILYINTIRKYKHKDDPNPQYSKATMGQVTIEIKEYLRSQSS